MKVKSFFLMAIASSLAVVGDVLPSFARPAVLSTRSTTSWINVRAWPSTTSTIRHQGRAGDRVEIIRDAKGNDGAIWHYLKFNNSNAEGWIRSDFVQALPSPSASIPSPQPPQAIVRPEPKTQRLNQEQIDYFVEVAMGAEFGKSSPIVRKWKSDIIVQAIGTPTAEDRRTLDAVVRELRELTGLNITLGDRNANMTIYFVPEPEFRRYEPNYIPRNYGFFWTQWNNNTIYNARILISTTGVTQRERSHLIREEVTQSLGLMRDSFKYPDSIFYQGWTDTTEYSEMDRAIIRLLYRPEIRPGMTQEDVLSILAAL
ncbi:DUF2927 domain-containing protein [Kamptonema cortianum]|nr:DUF2927 domain-containing protein [Kamptonema cortianum]